VAVLSLDASSSDVVRAEISWKEMGVPDDVPEATPEEQFVTDMERVLRDENEEAADEDGCMIQEDDGNTYHVTGVACCEDKFSKAVGECAKPMKGCTIERMATSRANFNVCATAAQRGCDDERDAYKAAHAPKVVASKKKQLKSIAAAASNPSELMFAALTAVTDKHMKDGSVEEESVKEAVEPASISSKPVNLLTVHRRCMETRMGACHAKVHGAKARHMAACKAMHATMIANCRKSAKATRDSCASADPTAKLFPGF